MEFEVEEGLKGPQAAQVNVLGRAEEAEMTDTLVPEPAV